MLINEGTLNVLGFVLSFMYKIYAIPNYNIDLFTYLR